MDTDEPGGHRGEADVASIAALFADRTRARVLTALADGRSLPASVLAGEAGVSAPAASAQLSRLLRAGLVTVEQSGRHRYYRLASQEVATVLESLAAIAPDRPVRSLRQGTRAAALRRARTCYDHLAGRLGCALTQRLVELDALRPLDGESSTARRAGDVVSKPLATHPYRLGDTAGQVFGRLGLAEYALLDSRSGERPLLRFCLDWSEQRHHLAGRLGADVLATLTDAGWVRRRRGQRAVDLTDTGLRELESRLGLTIPA